MYPPPATKRISATAEIREAAKKIGALIAERAKAKGITTVVFDRGGNVYQGRVKELADGAREEKRP